MFHFKGLYIEFVRSLKKKTQIKRIKKKKTCNPTHPENCHFGIYFSGF